MKNVVQFLLVFMSCLFHMSSYAQKSVDVTPLHNKFFWSFVPREISTSLQGPLGQIEKATLPIAQQKLEKILVALSDPSKIVFLPTHLRKPLSEMANEDIQSLISILTKLEPSSVQNGQLLFAAKTVKAVYQTFIFGGDLTYALSKTVAPKEKLLPQDKKPELSQYLPNRQSPLEYDPQTKVITKKWNFWRSYDFNDEVDYVIVGSGPAGSLLSYELQKKGYTVLLLEKGSFWLPGSFESRLVGDFREGGGQIPTADGSMSTLWGTSLGGGAAVNGDVVIQPSNPMLKHNFDKWQNLWKRSTLLKAEEAVSTFLNTRDVKEEELCYQDPSRNRNRNTNNCLLYDGARASGLDPHFYKRNDQVWDLSKISSKNTVQEKFLFPAMNAKQNQLTVIPDADVVNLIKTSKDGKERITEVQFLVKKPWSDSSGKQIEGVISTQDLYGKAFDFQPNELVRVKARNVILSAGALGSPTILKRAGFANENIGKGLIIHPVTYVSGIYDENTDVNMQVADGSQSLVHVEAWAKPENKDLTNYLILTGQFLPSGVASSIPGSPANMLHWSKNYAHSNTLLLGVIDLPRDHNKLTFAPGPNGYLNPMINYKMGEEEKERLADAVKNSVSILLNSGAKEVIIHSTENLLKKPDNFNLENPDYTYITNENVADFDFKKLQFTPHKTFLAGFHGQSTNKMGTNPDHSVIGPDYRVWGTKNLYVVDASIFPASVGSHPMQSIYIAAKIFADRIKPK